MKKEGNTYMAIPCGISDQIDRLTSHVETELNSEIRTPANSKSKVRIIRQLSKTKVDVECLWLCKYCHAKVHIKDRKVFDKDIVHTYKKL